MGQPLLPQDGNNNPIQVLRFNCKAEAAKDVPVAAAAQSAVHAFTGGCEVVQITTTEDCRVWFGADATVEATASGHLLKANFPYVLSLGDSTRGDEGIYTHARFFGGAADAVISISEME